MPSAAMSRYSPLAAFRPSPAGSSRTFSTTTPPSRPAFSAICLSGADTDSRTMFAPTACSSTRPRASIFESAAFIA